MSGPPEAIETSYEACRRVGRRSGSSFAAAFLLLPKAKRRAMDALYAFMRHSDDLVDDPPPGSRPAEDLDRWRAAVEQALSGGLDAAETGPTAAPPAQLDPLGRALLPALADTVRRFQIPHEHLRAVLDGMEMDLTRRRYRTFDELRTYCEHVASAVGLACIHIWGFESEEAMGPARSMGIALQLTNILRDLREDVRKDRVYVPLEDLDACGYTVEELGQGAVNQAFLRLVELEADRAEGYYREGFGLIRWLGPDGRRALGVMTATYHALLRKIQRRPGDVFTRRVRLTWPERLPIIARWTLLRPTVAAMK